MADFCGSIRLESVCNAFGREPQRSGVRTCSLTAAKVAGDVSDDQVQVAAAIEVSEAGSIGKEQT
jgi:hypothetical protein